MSAISNKTTAERLSYSAVLPLLAVEVDGKSLAPECALVKYEDGWRMFAIFRAFGSAVRVTAYTVDPMEAVRNADT